MGKTLFVFILFGCTLTDVVHFDIDPSLKVYVNNFYNQAEKRGFIFQKDNLAVELGNLQNGKDGAYGMTYGPGDIIKIDREFANDQITHFNLPNGIKDSTHFYFLEYVVFHELGHAVLARKHLDVEGNMTIMTSDNWYLGNYQSIMTDRKKMIDELFTK